MNQFKRKLTAFTAALAFLSLSSTVAYAVEDVVSAGQGNIMGVVNGAATFTDNRADYNNITNQNGGVAQFDIRNGNLNAGNQWNFGFSGLSQTTIARILNGQTSKILGRLTSSCINGGACTSFNETSKVLLINPAGVIFGPGSQVDINSLTTSTFDIKGAKNISDLSAAGLEQYKQDVLNKASAYGKTGSVELDSNYVKAFEDAGIKNADKIIQGSAIKLDGATFSHWNKDFTQELSGNENTNKSLAFVANKIDYKDSILRTGQNYNYIAGTTGNNVIPYSFSNVKLITADGVTFNYAINGYVDGHKIAETDNHPDLARTITMDNSGLIAKDASKEAIVSGYVDIHQRSSAKADGGQTGVRIKDTIVKGTKLINTENGNIVITASDDVIVDHSRLNTENTVATIKQLNGKSSYGSVSQKDFDSTNDQSTIVKTTTDKYGGEVYIKSDKNVTVKDSTILTAGSTKEAKNFDQSGAVRIIAGQGTAKVDSSKLLSDGHTKVKSGDKVEINNSVIQARNVSDTSLDKNITIVAPNSVKITNTDMHAKGDIDILAGEESTGKFTGDVTIEGNANKKIAHNDANQPTMKAQKSISIKGKNTTVDNVTLVYNEAEGLNFYDSTKSGADYTNNVTIKNGTAFYPFQKDASTGKEKVSSDVTIETNGDLTFDNATPQRSPYAIKFDTEDGKGNHGYNVDGQYYHDDGSIDSITYETKANPKKVDAVNLNARSTQGNVNVINNSTLSASNDVNITADKGNIKVDSSSVLAKANNATLTASKGKINITASSKIEAGNDANVTALNNITVNKSNIIAGSDTAGFDGTKDANDTIGSANITSKKGSVNIKNGSKVLSQDKDVNITAFNAIKFGNAVPSPETPSQSGDNIDSTVDITALHNVNITSTNDNIEGEKTTMPTIKYGDRLTFDAAKNNIFTSQDSLKSVNVDYKAGEANKIYTQGDAQFVNSSFEAPTNFVESGKDVILNNLEIKKATTDAKDTTTEIFANGNVTTYNVTGEDLGAKDAGDYHSYPQSVKTDRVAKGDKTMPEYVKGLDSTKLNINQTKLKVQTDTVKDASNPDNGSITLVLQNADNTKAGVELTARNVKKLDQDPTTGNFKQGYYKTGTPEWDENINPKEGPEIVLGSADGKIAIKELYSDKLTLNPNDKMFADNTDGTPVITVKDQGGLNLDPTLNYEDGTPNGFTYDKNYETKDKTVTGGDLTFDEWTEWTPIREYMDEEGNTHTIYESTRDGRITDRITTQTDQKHTITFDNKGNPSEFTLVYDKKSTTVEPGREITAQQVKDDPSIIPDVKKPDGTKPTPDDFIKTKDDITPCPPKPPVDRHDNILPSTDDVAKVTLPREQVEISKTSTVADNTADQTSNIMSAAARVDLSKEADASYDDDDDKTKE